MFEYVVKSVNQPANHHKDLPPNNVGHYFQSDKYFDLPVAISPVQPRKAKFVNKQKNFVFYQKFYKNCNWR